MNIGQIQEELTFSINKDLATKVLIKASVNDRYSSKELRLISLYAYKALEPYLKHLGITKEQFSKNHKLKEQTALVLLNLIRLYITKKECYKHDCPDIYDDKQIINLSAVIRNIQNASKEYVEFKKNIEHENGFVGNNRDLRLFDFISSTTEIRKKFLKASEDKYYLFDSLVFESFGDYFLAEKINKEDYLNDDKKRKRYREVFVKKRESLKSKNGEFLSNSEMKNILNECSLDWIIICNNFKFISDKQYRNFIDSITFDTFVLLTSKEQQELYNKSVLEREKFELVNSEEKVEFYQSIDEDNRKRMENVWRKIGAIRADSTIRNLRKLENMLNDTSVDSSNDFEKKTM